MNRRLLALCFGNFVIGTGTLIVPGMLNVLADGLQVPIPVAGRLIAFFAITVAVGAPLLAGATSRLDRRTLLVAMLLLFVAGHVLAALAPDYRALAAARVASAVSAALFTSQAAATAGLLVPAKRRGSAIAFVFMGWSAASVAGMPLGAWLGSAFGWRAAFAAVAALAAAGALAVWSTLPGGLRTEPIGRAAWRNLMGNPVLLAVIAVTAIQSWAQFTLYAYVTPAFRALVDADGRATAALLAVFGVTGVLGNVLAGRLMDRLGAARIAAASIVVMMVGHAAWLVASHTLPGLVAALLLWGLGCFAANSAQQARLAGLAPWLAPVSIALNTSAIYLGQALGSETGGQLLAHLEPARLPWASLPVFAVSLALSSWAAHRERR